LQVGIETSCQLTSIDFNLAVHSSQSTIAVRSQKFQKLRGIDNQLMDPGTNAIG
jgi:hypothetical protein